MIGRVQFLDYDSTNPNAILPQCNFSGLIRVVYYFINFRTVIPEGLNAFTI